MIGNSQTPQVHFDTLETSTAHPPMFVYLQTQLSYHIFYFLPLSSSPTNFIVLSILFFMSILIFLPVLFFTLTFYRLLSENSLIPKIILPVINFQSRSYQNLFWRFLNFQRTFHYVYQLFQTQFFQQVSSFSFFRIIPNYH